MYPRSPSPPLPPPVQPPCFFPAFHISSPSLCPFDLPLLAQGPPNASLSYVIVSPLHSASHHPLTHRPPSPHPSQYHCLSLPVHPRPPHPSIPSSISPPRFPYICLTSYSVPISLIPPTLPLLDHYPILPPPLPPSCTAPPRRHSYHSNISLPLLLRLALFFADEQHQFALRDAVSYPSFLPNLLQPFADNVASTLEGKEDIVVGAILRLRICHPPPGPYVSTADAPSPTFASPSASSTATSKPRAFSNPVPAQRDRSQSLTGHRPRAPPPPPHRTAPPLRLLHLRLEFHFHLLRLWPAQQHPLPRTRRGKQQEQIPGLSAVHLLTLDKSQQTLPTSYDSALRSPPSAYSTARASDSLIFAT
ncbi:hypothetical protein B0H13DRAFT_2317485 [Mycena leptocephala]|nr:hypothetical protein B0H13DRAFT_2317485 [Mycena leptocephala]